MGDLQVGPPFASTETGRISGGPKAPMSNHVFVDARCLIYPMDGHWGLHILEFSPIARHSAAFSRRSDRSMALSR